MHESHSQLSGHPGDCVCAKIAVSNANLEFAGPTDEADDPFTPSHSDGVLGLVLQEMAQDHEFSVMGSVLTRPSQIDVSLSSFQTLRLIARRSTSAMSR